MVIEPIAGVAEFIPKYKPKKKAFKKAECDPHDFEARLKAVREYARKEESK